MTSTCNNRAHDGLIERFEVLERQVAGQQRTISDLRAHAARADAHAARVNAHLLHPHQRVVMRHVLARSEQAIISQVTGVRCKDLLNKPVRDLHEGELYVERHPHDAQISAEKIRNAREQIERHVPRAVRERVRKLARTETHSDDIIPHIDELRSFRDAFNNPRDADLVVALYLRVFPRGLHARVGGGAGGAEGSLAIGEADEGGPDVAGDGAGDGGAGDGGADDGGADDGGAGDGGGHGGGSMGDRERHAAGESPGGVRHSRGSRRNRGGRGHFRQPHMLEPVSLQLLATQEVAAATAAHVAAQVALQEWRTAHAAPATRAAAGAR